MEEMKQNESMHSSVEMLERELGAKSVGVPPLSLFNPASRRRGTPLVSSSRSVAGTAHDERWHFGLAWGIKTSLTQ